MKINPLQWRTIGAQRRPPPASASQTEQLEAWSPVCLAWAIDQGLAQHTPLQLTARGWRWVRANGPRERAIVYGLIGEEKQHGGVQSEDVLEAGDAPPRAQRFLEGILAEAGDAGVPETPVP